MIENDPRRASEYFRNPVQSGREGRNMPFSTGQILGFYLLRAIVLGLSSYWLFTTLPPREFSDATMDPQSAEAMASIQAFVNYYMSSPLLLTFVEFVSGLVATTLFWQISRAFTGSELSWQDAQSSMVRFLLVTAAIGVVLNITQAIMPGAWVQTVSLIAGIYLFVIMLLVFQGANELKSVGSSLLVLFLSILAIFGLIFVGSLIFTIFTL